MHRVRRAVRENRLSEHSRISETSYLPYVEARWAWVAETDSGLAGFAAINARTREVWALFVTPADEGKGFGRALHAALLAWAKAAGCTELTLATDRNSRAAEFYRRAGWVQAAVSLDGQSLLKMRL
jgi:GNAT superfamily N-acetyltransferase